MSNDGLLKARHIRSLAVLGARRELELALAAEQRAASRLHETINAIHREIAVAAGSAASNGEVEALAGWLRHASAEQAAAENALAAAEAGTAQARAVLAAACSAEASIAELIDARAGSLAARRQRQAQSALEEAAVRRHPAIISDRGNHEP